MSFLRYGGRLPYDTLHAVLNQYHFGIVTESHNENLKAMSSASLQTKINDYFLAGLPVLCFGPEYGACRKFLMEHDLGFCFTETDVRPLVNNICIFLNKSSILDHQQKARAFLLKNNDKIIGREKFQRFLSEA
jgi:hypothetical protein